MLHDFRSAIRSLRRVPGYSAVIVVTLALAIGATTTIYGVVNGVLLRPLPFADASFDLVFTKDSVIHIPDKHALYLDVFRVLRPGGLFAGSDWLRGGEGPHTPEMQNWLDVVGLTFEMKNAEQTRAVLEAAGFTDVRTRDRNKWYRREITREIGFTFKAGYLAHSLAKGRSDPSIGERFPPTTLADPELPGRLNPRHDAHAASLAAGGTGSEP